ncbi:hypothetical protein [Roseibacillus persicicus]|uniref:hypothetical protein n=1 Tax=Roseibacillus persicicus TaxID=454148 RepID=UPI00280EA7B8|nr:hypothetical protein [Roseibacillus persicicus]MDQ8192163.1 hypothetical protein [Roseibacillus persicicus]
MIRILIVTFAVALFTPSVFALPSYPKDQFQLHISDFTDPNYPVVRVGERKLSFISNPPPTWTVTKVFLEHSNDFDDFASGSPRTSSILFQTLGPRQIRGEYIMSWNQPKDSALPDKPTETYQPGDEVHYRWVIEYSEEGIAKSAEGDIHTFTMPRRIILAILGDSYGSGEGAPNFDPALGDHWLYHNEGKRGHRSAISGQELAVQSFFDARPNLAYDYVNLSSSGAIAKDIYSSVSQFDRIDPEPDAVDFGRAVTFPQGDKLSEWLTERDYSALDAVILSCGGNDLGFEAILTNYLGLNLEKIGAAALDGLLDPGCIALGVATAAAGAFTPPAIAFAISNYTSCAISSVVANVLIAVYEDATFTDAYKAVAISGNRYRSFNWYVNRLENEYNQLGRAISRDLRNGHRQVPVGRVFVTSYPFPLKDCTSFWENPPLLQLQSDATVIEIDLFSLPGLSFIRDPEPLTFNIAGIKSIPVIFTEEETREASFELAPAADDTRPSFGGMNHHLQDFVAAVDAAESSEWCFVKTNNFLPARTGVCYSGTHFNTLTTAANQAGPNIISNAYHPNQDGHRYTYQPAILDALKSKLTNAELAAIAQEEGLYPAAHPLADLAFEPGFPTYDFDPSTSTLNVTVSLVNRGNLSIAEGAEVFFLMEGLPGNTFPPSPLPAMDINDVVQFSRSFEIPLLPVASDFLYECESGPYEGFEEYASKDEVLRYFLSRAPRTFEVILNARQSFEETNHQNNGDSQTLVVPADGSQNELQARAEQVLSELSALLNRPVETVDLALLITEQPVRFYFGYYSPPMDDPQTGATLKTPGQVLAERQALKASICLARNHGIGSPDLPDPVGSSGPVNNLRPICLFPPVTTDCPTDDSLVRDSLGRLQELDDALRNAPRDGRNAVITAILDEQFADILGIPELEYEVNIPALTGGIKFPTEDLVLSTPTPTFTLTQINEAVSSTLTLGSVRGAADIMGPQLREGKGDTITARQIPQDGREVFAALTTTFPDGTRRSEEYRFATVKRNAALTSPSPNQAVPSNGATFAWSAPDAAAAGPVQAYSIAVGSYPGTGDIVPIGLEPLGKSQGKGLKNSPPAIAFEQLSPEELSFTVNSLPQDGRNLYITLGTLRDGVWEYELHRRRAAESVAAGLRSPLPDRPIFSRETFQISPGQLPAEAYVLKIGTNRGGNDLFESDPLDEREISQPMDIILAEMEVQTDSENRPLPIWATVESLGGEEGSFSESYALIPSLNASFFAPNPSEVLPEDASVQFRWSRGVQAIAYRLRIFAEENEGQPIIDETFDPDTLEASISLEGIDSTAFVATLDTIRDPEAEGLETGFYSVIYTIEQPVLQLYNDDEISNAWQLDYFGAGNPDALPLADPDGDGCNNLCEFLARTDPTDSSDFFTAEVTLAPGNQPSNFTISDPVPSTRYRISQSTDLDSWAPLNPGINPTPGQSQLQLDIPASPDPAKFYRLELRP